MCGIVGAYGKDWKYAYQALDLIRHRGPDGRVVQPLSNGYLAHARLAIVDVEGGRQPLQSTEAAHWLICNGEIYNHPDLRLVHDEYPFLTHSDSEDILAVYRQYGGQATHHLEGMYAFALVDEEDIFLARDPLGIKPLYYGWDGETFYFASEIKALQDIVTRVEEFPPGHTYSNRHGFRRYYDLETIVQTSNGKAESVTPALVQQQLRRAVQSHLMADVPVGVFLSGGLDSSVIAALAKEQLPELHSFTVGTENSVDRVYARQVAEYLGTQHHEYIYSQQEMLEVLPEVIYYLESFDPALIRSAIANYFLARLASSYVKVILSGEGADELFSGYHYLKQLDSQQALQRELLEITDELHNRNLQRLDRMTMAHGIEGRVPFLDRQFVEFAFSIPIEQKLDRSQIIEKRILREAFSAMLPHEVVWRVKEKFAVGAGSAHIFEQLAEIEISDTQFQQEVDTVFAETQHRIRSKEELYYYRIFRRYFKPSVVPLVGFSRSL